MDGNVRIEDLEQHLLFHKAMSENTETYQRIGGYMDILSKAENGERLPDPVDEAIRSVFSLVLENGIDPWEINLSEFVKMYNSKVVSNAFDMIVAGKLMLMAWKILRMQSDSTRTLSEPPIEEFGMDIDDSFFYEDEETMVVPEVILTEAFQREPVRPVTMYELIDAFEEARAEIEIQQERERVRSQLKAKEPTKFDNKAHEEDDARDVEQVWARIQKLGTGQICIEDLYTNDLKENLKTFVSILHLVRVGRLNVWQDSLPYGDIFVEIMTEGASGTIEDSIAGRIEAVM
ncbi:MAG: chromosome segregation protein ScpA [Candidatus Methanomethylophilaceae archaeon]|jgi:segregation and condensation protein A|nr:chromosome segregation protein ScpA [Candidatus Methanomethylophilaceae archaeon]MBR4685215.1 chromosome segregation protein ScpA [Candidatus Methanomethylophilaceae archaeon]